jgi:hypothetical protein
VAASFGFLFCGFVPLCVGFALSLSLSLILTLTKLGFFSCQGGSVSVLESVTKSVLTVPSIILKVS